MRKIIIDAQANLSIASPLGALVTSPAVSSRDRGVDLGVPFTILLSNNSSINIGSNNPMVTHAVRGAMVKLVRNVYPGLRPGTDRGC